MRLDKSSAFANAVNAGRKSGATSNGASSSALIRSRANPSKKSTKAKLNSMVTAVKKKSGKSANRARDHTNELSVIRSAEDLTIHHDEVLAVKRGDLSIIQGEVFRASPAAPHLAEIPLVVKRLECVDRRTYDLKVYEADSMSRFKSNANIVPLFSYWAEPGANAYTFKTLVLLMAEGTLGSAKSSVVENQVRPSGRTALRYACDLAKGLSAIHNCNFIHGSVKPSSIYLDSEGTAMLGEFGKVELDSARQTHQLFSKLLIGQAISSTLVYWAPELLKLEKYNKAADMWALGVTLYEMATGVLPFNTTDEALFRDDVLTANVNMAPLMAYPRLATVIQNLIKVDPEERWTAAQVLAYAQSDFAVDIQRSWRGFSERKEFKRQRAAVELLQAHFKGYITARKYKKQRDARREEAALVIQKTYRGSKDRAQFNKEKSAIMKCQANVLAKQQRQSFRKTRDGAIMAQAYVRGFMARKWYRRVRAQRDHIIEKLDLMENLAVAHPGEIAELESQLPAGKLPPSLKHLSSFEDYQLAKEEAGGASVLPGYKATREEAVAAKSEVETLTKQVEDLKVALGTSSTEDEKLREELGPKYEELAPMIDALKKNLRRVADACAKAITLPIKMQHAYTYSKWDTVHDPGNVVENVLADDEGKIYKALQPSLDFTLCSGSVCFLSEIHLTPGDCGPAKMEVYTSNVLDKWTLVSTHDCTREANQSFLLPGEQLCKYLRIKFPSNVRGGNIVSVKRIKVKGNVRT